jgi:predicted O-linked N-acetylglucosamine transferase (SPINDLY family)
MNASPRPAADGAADRVAALLARGLAAHKAARIPEAIDIYTQVLALDPEQPYALHLLGEIAHRAGRNERAVELIERAIVLLPELAEAHNNLGTAYQALGRLGPAEASYRRAIALKPSLIIAGNNLGTVLKAQGKVAEARRQFERTLTLDPNAPESCLNLGNLLREGGDFAAAEDCYRIVTDQHPENSAGWNNLGILRLDQLRPEEARIALERAVACDSHSADARNNLGNALRALRRFDEAIAEYRNALALRPDYPQAYNNIGVALTEVSRYVEALPFFRKAVELDADFVEGLLNLGACLRQVDQLSEAIACFERVLQLEPENPKGYNYRGLTRLEVGKVEEGLADCRAAFKRDPNYARARSNYLFGLNYRPGIGGAELLSEHIGFALSLRQPPRRDFPNRRDPDRPLRIGYVSPDFKRHSCAFFIEPLIAGHGPGPVEVYCYSDVPTPDAVTLRIKGHATHWRDTSKLFESEFIDAVLADQIDIAVDLTGHTGNNRLVAFSQRIAPIQVSWLGYPCTTGLGTIDYRLTDGLADPPGETDSHYSESLVRLPRTFLCYQPAADAPDPVPPPALGGAPFTFGSFNNLPKVNAEVIETWAAILARAPASRLLLKSRALTGADACAHIHQEFSRHGVDPARVELVGWVRDPAGHLALYNQIDLALDPFPYNGTTTTCEAMWMGVPVLALAGARHAARVGASLLAQVGLSDFIATTADDYVARAVGHALNPGPLADVRSALRARMAASPLCDGRAFARDVEAAYRGMWRSWCNRN